MDKIRINPGNIGGEERFKEVVRKARDKGIPMRIGVNSGSLEKDLIEKYGYPCPEALVESASAAIETAESLGYRDIIVSLKASHVPTAVATYTLFASQCDYPTHVGITEAGSREYGTLKSAAGIGAILLRGIGDTIRVSLLGDPVPEIAAGFDILRACDRRVNKPEVVACPTCGRLDIDLERIVAEVEAKMAHLTRPVADQHPRLPRQWLRRGQGSRHRHRRRRGQGRHLQARRPDPPRQGSRNGRGPPRRGRPLRRRHPRAEIQGGSQATPAARA